MFPEAQLGGVAGARPPLAPERGARPPVSIKTPFFDFELCTLQKGGSADSRGRRVLKMPETS